MAFPESNRDGVLSALRSLQEKMARLEMERREAESNLQTLATETELYKNTLHHQNHRDTRPVRNGLDDTGDLAGSGTSSPRQSKGLESQLSSAETRCQLLEKQLDYMKKMVHNAEHERSEAVQKAETLQNQKKAETSPLTPDYRAQLDRIGMLERDHLRLTATQTLAEAKIKELEEKLRDEKNHRQMLQDRALDLESAAISHRILIDSAPIPDKNTRSSQAKVKKAPSVKKKKKKVTVVKKPVAAKSEPMKHYRLNLAEIPFVAGKSTGPSHAVGANVQKVLAMMKSHNLALCSSLYNGHSCNGEVGSTSGRCNSPSLSSGSSMSLDQDLADLLQQLQDEFGQLSFEHQEYMRHIHEAKDPRIQEDLERELDALVLRMEAKGQQISKVRQHQQKLEDAKRQGKRLGKKFDPPPRPHSAMGRLSASHKHTDDRSGNVRPKSAKNAVRNCADIAHPSLNVLRDMRKLQSTLRRDDLCWE